jgi:iron complex outermembrane receptor protein
MSKKSNWGRILLTGASLAAMGAVTPAFAQDDDVSEEIVVTATGRAAAIQDVPIAVTAVSGETLENTGVQDLRDVTQVAPSLTIGTGQSNSSGTLVSIRGIGTGSDNPGFEGAVGIFIDGVYRARAGAALADLPELERVEILRGPQGTLFGRNTSAGAISVITAGPDFDPGMYIEALLGIEDVEETGLRAGVNVPVTDTLAFRLDGTVREREGYITDVTSGDDLNTTDRWSGRAQAVWDISNDASLRVIVDAAESDEVCCGVTPLIYGSTQGVIQVITAGTGTPPGFAGGALPLSFAGALNTRIEEREMTVTPGRSYGETTEDFGVSGELNWDIGGINLTSITAFRDWTAERDQDVDFTSADIAYRDGLEVNIETFTQELRLQGEFGPVNWLAGVFYGDETINTTDRIRLGTQTVAYTNTATIGNTDAFVPGPNNGCELVDVVAAPTFPSIFQCVTGLFGNPAPLVAAVNGTNGGYLLPSAPGQGQQTDQWNVETQSISVFTHNEIALAPAWTLTIGARYNQDTKELTSSLNATNTTCDSLRLMETNTVGLTPLGPGVGIVTAIQTIDPDGPGPAQAGALSSLMNLACNPAVNPIANGNRTGEREESEFSGTASIAYNLSDDTLLYAGYSRGYKAGGFNLDRSGFNITPATTSAATAQISQLEFEPEFTDAYELGLKTTIFGGSTTANLSVFLQQIHDYQSNNFNGFNFITRNVPEVISQGAELEINARPTDNLTLNAGIVYTDAYYDSTVVFNSLDPVPNTITAGQPLAGAGAAEWTVTSGISYEMPVTAGISALFYLDGRWNSGYRTQTLARPTSGISDNDAFALFNGRISLRSDNDRWSIDLWGQNLTDEFYYVGAFQPPLQNTTVVYPNAPRTWGVTARLQY